MKNVHLSLILLVLVGCTANEVPVDASRLRSDSGASADASHVVPVVDAALDDGGPVVEQGVTIVFPPASATAAPMILVRGEIADATGITSVEVSGVRAESDDGLA